MNRTLVRYLGLACAVAFCHVGTSLAERAPVVLFRAVNRASVPSKTLIQAQVQVTRTLAMSGITAVWLDTSLISLETHDQSTLCIVIVGHSVAESIAPRKQTLGLTPGEKPNEGYVAYVFYDRVEHSSAFYRLNANSTAEKGQVLAYAILHEAGHLLLPPPAHSDTGIMHNIWNAGEFKKMSAGKLFFTREQGRLMQAAVRERASNNSRR